MKYTIQAGWQQTTQTVIKNAIFAVIIAALSLAGTLGIVLPQFVAAITTEFNGTVTGFVEVDDSSVVSGRTEGTYDTTISGSITGGTPGQSAQFSGTISGAITGDITGGVNYNGFDTLSAEITNSGADGYVYLIGYFAGPAGEFVADFKTVSEAIDFSEEITISGEPTVGVGETIQFSATTDGASSDVKWAVYLGTESDTGYGNATIDESTGLLTANTEGKVIVIASALDGSLITKNYEVTIVPAPYEPTAPPVRPTIPGEVIYDAISPVLPSSYPSLGYQATSTTAFGDKITFDGTARNLEKVAVTMTSWACENNTWNSGNCETTPGATFSQPLTLDLYNSDGSDVGDPIASVTQTFEIPFRPTSDPTCSPSTSWRDTTGACFSGYNHIVVFDIENVVVPDTIIYSVSFNTQAYGSAPTDIDGPYNSLNIGLNADSSAPYVGTDVVGGELYWDSTYLGRTPGLAADDGWGTYQVAALFTASEVDTESPTLRNINMFVNGTEGNVAKTGDSVRIVADVNDASGIDRVQVWVRDYPSTKQQITSGEMALVSGDTYDFTFTMPANYQSGDPVQETFEGNYFNFRPWDSLGNSAIGYRTNFTVDNTAPSAPSITAPNARTWHKTTPILNQWTASTDDGSGVAGYQVAYQYDEGYSFSSSTCDGANLEIGNPELFIGCRNVSSTSRNHTPTISEQGGVTIWVRAYDNAGNYSDWSNPVHYYYDHESPTTTINAPTGVVGDNFTVSGEANDNLALNRVYVQLVNRDNNQRYGGTTISLIGEGTSAEWSKTFSVDDFNLSDGVYAAHVGVVDMAGNTGSAGWTKNFTLDNTGPDVSSVLLNGQLVDDYTRSANCEAIKRPLLVKGDVNFSVIIDDELSDVRGASYRVRKVTAGGCTQSNIFNSSQSRLQQGEDGRWAAGAPFDTSQIEDDGLYTMQLTTTDSVGNSTTIFIDLEVDNTSPSVQIDPASSMVEPGVSVTLSALDVSDDVIEYLWGTDDSQLVITPINEDTVEVTSDTEGTFTVSLLVTDAAGNQTTQTAEVTFKNVADDNSNDENQAQRVTPAPPNNQGTQQAAAAGAQGGPVLAAVTGGAQNIGIQGQAEDEEEDDEQEVTTQQLLGNNSSNNREARNGEVLGITDDPNESSSSATWVWILLAVLGAGSLLLLFARKQVEQEQQ